MRQPSRFIPLLFLLPFLLLSSLAFALTLELPIDCPRDGLCVIQTYVDRTQSPDARDYTCGSLTSPEHNGTDFRISQTDMEKGVAVRAAAAGVVRGFRDGVEDVSVKKIDRKKIRNREAGNGVRIEHEDGYVTQYSHLRKGSVRVRPGQKVQAGQILGLVGMSGNTEFPHLELAVRQRGRPICPFTGPAEALGCEGPRAPLWSPAALKSEVLKYRPTGLLDAGFLEAAPQVNEEPTSLPRAKTLPATAPAIVFWAAVFGLQTDDVQTIQLIAPDGQVLARASQAAPGNKAQRVAAVGRKRAGLAPWPSGEYRGEFALSRPGPEGSNVIVRIAATLLVQ